MSKSKSYWLFKTEPDVFSIFDLEKSHNQTSSWEGVRNYQARNYLRDEVKRGDDFLFYHSRIEPGVYGIGTIVKEGYVDHYAFDKKSKYYDAKSKPERPSWYMVDVRLKSIFENPVTLKRMKDESELTNMKLLQKGNRLSIMPVTELEFKRIIDLSKINELL